MHKLKYGHVVDIKMVNNYNWCMKIPIFILIQQSGEYVAKWQSSEQAGRRLVRSLLTLRVFVVDVMDLPTGNRNEDDS